MERLIFFGTPEFALPTLEALCDADRRPLLVVSQPDRARGRRRQLVPPPVAGWARDAGLQLRQPPDVRAPEFQQAVAALAPTVAVVVAFGQIFPKALLDLPSEGCINVHASLLPRHRGAAPVQAAIISGDTVTGVTTMLMDEGLDTGPILLQREVEIGEEETAGELAERLSQLGAELLIETLDRRAAGALVPRPQDPRRATTAPRLRRDDGIVDWRDEAQEIFNRLRGLTPWPGVSTRLRGEPVKILWGRPGLSTSGRGEAPGTCLGLVGDTLQVACGSGSTFAIERLQRAGRQAVTAIDFVNGVRLEPGERFG